MNKTDVRVRPPSSHMAHPKLLAVYTHTYIMCHPRGAMFFWAVPGGRPVKTI